MFACRRAPSLPVEGGGLRARCVARFETVEVGVSANRGLCEAHLPGISGLLEAI